jgi:hypothetical protein
MTGWCLAIEMAMNQSISGDSNSLHPTNQINLSTRDQTELYASGSNRAKYVGYIIVLLLYCFFYFLFFIFFIEGIG